MWLWRYKVFKDLISDKFIRVESSSNRHVRAQQGGVICKLERELSPDQTILAPWSLTSSTQNCKKINFSCLAHSVYGILLWWSWQYFKGNHCIRNTIMVYDKMDPSIKALIQMDTITTPIRIMCMCEGSFNKNDSTKGVKCSQGEMFNSETPLEPANREFPASLTTSSLLVLFRVLQREIHMQ